MRDATKDEQDFYASNLRYREEYQEYLSGIREKYPHLEPVSFDEFIKIKQENREGEGDG